MSKFKVFLSYLRHRAALYLAVICFFILTTIIFFLFDLSMVPLLLLFSLIMEVTLVFFLVDFIRFINRHKNLQIDVESIETMPESFFEHSHLIENDYLHIIKSLCDAKDMQMRKSTEAYADMMEYYSVWAHQIKTPISALSLTIQNIEDEELKGNLKSELLRIEEYVDMVLNYLRLDSETNDFLFKKISVEDIVKGEIKRFMPLFMNKRIALEYDPIDFKVVSDRKWLGFCIGQLLSNALKYTKAESKVKIYSNSSNTITIEDNGIGIASEDLPRIFDRGYTGYNGRQEKKSTGIGLYLVKRTADKLGIRVEIDSTIGVGTKAIIFLNSKDSSMIKD